MSNFNFDLIVDAIGRVSVEKEQKLSEFTENMDPNSTQDILLLQQYMQEWSVMTNLQSATVKTLKDVLSSVVQKM